MNIFHVDVQLSSIKEDSLSCISLFPLPPALLSHTEVIHIGKPPHQSLAWVSLGPYSVFLVSVRRIRVIHQPQLVDDAIAGNSWPVQTSLTLHSKPLVILQSLIDLIFPSVSFQRMQSFHIF